MDEDSLEYDTHCAHQKSGVGLREFGDLGWAERRYAILEAVQQLEAVKNKLDCDVIDFCRGLDHQITQQAGPGKLSKMVKKQRIPNVFTTVVESSPRQHDEGWVRVEMKK